METIKEEKKADLKQLLNSLIEKGWKPREKYEMEYQYMLGGKEHGFYDLYFIRGHYPVRVPIKHSLRELVSKESGLWQFVCENGMIKTNGCCNGWVYHDEYDDYNNGTGIYDEEMLPRYYDTEYQYRLLESSLKDESELEDFLLNSIKLD